MENQMPEPPMTVAKQKSGGLSEGFRMSVTLKQ